MNRLRVPVIAVLAVLTTALIVLVLRETFTRRVPGGNDLYPRWSAGCAWLTRGTDPYSPQATLAIQDGIYGRPALPTEDQVAFAYPAFSVVLVAPLCLTTDFATVHAAAMAALIAGVVATAALSRRAVGWDFAGWLWIWIVFWIVVAYPSARAILLGQLAVLVGVFQVGALAALRLRREVLAGILLALSTIKPQMAILIVPGLLFWGMATRRWRLLAGFGGAMAALLLIPMIWLPSWIPDWIAQLRVYPTYTEFGSATWILTTHLLGTPAAVEIALTAGLCFWLGFEWWKGRRTEFEPMLWVAGLTLVLTHFVSPRTATTHFGPLLVPVFMIFRVMTAPEGGRSRWAIAALMASAAVLSWILFLTTVQGRQESALNYLPLPILLLGGLIWIRGPWRGLAQGAA